MSSIAGVPGQPLEQPAPIDGAVDAVPVETGAQPKEAALAGGMTAAGAAADVAPGLGSVSGQISAAAFAARLHADTDGGVTRAASPGPVLEAKAVQWAKAQLQQRMATLAKESPEALGAILDQAYGGKLDPARKQELIEQAKSGTLPLPKTIRFVDPGTLKGANAAYSPKGGGTVYLNRDLLRDPKALQRALTEEVGHHLDQTLGGKDARGDEGEIFMRGLEAGGPIDAGALRTARADRDTGTVTIDGQKVPVEFQKPAAGVSKKAQKAVDTFVDQMSYAVAFPPDWKIGDGNVDNAIDAVDDLESGDRNQALSSLLLHKPKYVNRLFSNMSAPPDAYQIKMIAGWFTSDECSPAAKTAFVKGLKGEAFATFMKGVHALPKKERAEVLSGLIKSFGPKRWASKLLLERLRAEVNGSTAGLQAISKVIGLTEQALTALSKVSSFPGLPTGLSTMLGIYGKSLTAVSKGLSGAILKYIEKHGTQANTIVWGHQLSLKPLEKLGIKDPLAAIAQMRRALGKK